MWPGGRRVSRPYKRKRRETMLMQESMKYQYLKRETKMCVTGAGNNDDPERT